MATAQERSEKVYGLLQAEAVRAWEYYRESWSSLRSMLRSVAGKKEDYRTLESIKTEIDRVFFLGSKYRHIATFLVPEDRPGGPDSV